MQRNVSSVFEVELLTCPNYFPCGIIIYIFWIKAFIMCGFLVSDVVIEMKM